MRRLLAAQADADGRVGTVEVAVVSLASVNAAVHCTEEEVGAIAEADFGVWVFEGEARKAADIRHRHASVARVIRRYGKAADRMGDNRACDERRARA